MKSKLDRIFSTYIRLRDSEVNGYGQCISCGKVGHWKTMHNGHFVNRRHMSTRYSEKNCNMQCVSCNTFDEGNNLGYMRGLVKKYGENILSVLELQKHSYRKYSDFEYKALIKFYQEEVKKLKKEKNV